MPKRPLQTSSGNTAGSGCSQSILNFFQPTAKRTKSSDSRQDVIDLALAISARAERIAAKAGELEPGSAELDVLMEELKDIAGSPAIPLAAPAVSSVAPTPLRKTGQVKTQEYIFDITFTLFQSLHSAQPSHPIFGDVTPGKIQAPLTLSGRNAVSWKAKCKALAASIASNMGDYITPGDCWMKKDPYMSFQKKVDGKPSMLRSFMIVRLLAFVSHPSSQSWEALNGHSAGTAHSGDTPFTHWCHNGHGSKGGSLNGVQACVNGVQHGRFGTIQENTDQKRCREGSRATCPGHGEEGDHCFYVHEDGTQKPCLNLVGGPPERCTCARLCR